MCGILFSNKRNIDRITFKKSLYTLNHRGPDAVNYNFINNKSESIIQSMKSSESCIFGLSYNVNQAIEIKC